MANPLTPFRTALLLVPLALLAGLAAAWPRPVTPAVSDTRRASGVRPDSVAVLPFAAPADLHDGVKWHLSRWPKEVPLLLLEDSSLRVARPRSVEKLGLREDELWAGRQLAVATVLAGEVRAEDGGARLVVEAELLEVDTGLLLWAKSWEIADISKKNEILERIRVELADGVKKRLSREEMRPADGEK